MIQSAAGEVDLENARIAQVRRAGSNVSITVVDALVGAQQVELVLDLFDVTSESAVFHGTAGKQVVLEIGQVPPLDLVEVWSAHNGALELQGYRDREPWVIWRLKAKFIQASIGSNPSFNGTPGGAR